MISPDAFVLASKNFASGASTSAVTKEYLENLTKVADQLGRSNSWTVLDGVCNQLIAADERPTVGLLAALYAKTKTNDFSSQFETFLVQFDNIVENQNMDSDSLRSAAGVVSGTCEAIADQMIRRQQPILGISLMQCVIRKLQKTPTQLTGVHSVLLQLCLSAQCLKPALPYLIDDIDDFTNDISGSECKNLLLYFYYGGLVYAALKKYPEALFFLEACIRVPASTLSHIMLEAYKKYVLISLIHLGAVPQPHKTAMQTVNRVLKPAAAPYTELATKFTTNVGDISEVINKHQETFQRDSNFGLVKQVRLAQTKLKVQRLTKTFLTLSLADVASRVQLGTVQEAEKLILCMIQDGEIYAKINQLDGMVIFLDNKERYDNPTILNKVEDQISRCIELNKRLANMNESLSTNPDFISKVLMSGGCGGIGDDKELPATAIASSSSSSSTKAPALNL